MHAITEANAIPVNRLPALGVAALWGVAVAQGFHELEHIVQVVQRYALDSPNGNGLLGSVAEIEPLHFAYNTIYLAMLAAAFTSLCLTHRGPRYRGWLIFGGLGLALVIQSWHELEHIIKLAQYVSLHVNGTGGVFGAGPGGIVPIAPVPLLHLGYNTAAFAPALFAVFGVYRRRGQQHPATQIA